MQKQEAVYLENNIKFPIVIENDIIYYPMNYILHNVLFKQTNANSLKTKYKKYIKELNVDFYEGGIQCTYCISEYGLKEILKDSRIGGLSIDQKRAMNNLLKYLHMDLIIEDERFTKTIPDQQINSYNKYVRDCISYVLNSDPNVVWQRCSKCGNYYPYHVNFFRENFHSGKDYNLYTECRECCGWTENRSVDWMRCGDDYLSSIYRKYGIDIYKIYRDHDVMSIYNHWLTSGYKQFPKCINNENDKKYIIKELYKQGKFDNYETLTVKAILETAKFTVKGFLQEIIEELTGVKSRAGIEYVNDIETARRIFSKYLIDKNINNEKDILNITYDNAFKEMHLHGYLERTSNNCLTLVMDLLEDKYPAYKFKIQGLKYWDKKENRIKALKYLIEEDMKLELNKIPLYLTLTSLRDIGTSTMYNVCKKYYRCLWEWVDEVYPNIFDERDFHIHIIRNNFDSMEESEIHNILKKYFKSVIYNARNTDNTIYINGMIPDWLIFTKNGCIIVEYFGIAPKDNRINTRIDYCKKKMNNKIKKYEEVNGYRMLYFYPEDLKNKFEGVIEKINILKDKS